MDGENGTFILLGSPASKGNRLFVLGAFRAHSENHSFTQNNLKLRMFAIEFSDSTVKRIVIAWSYDFTIPHVLIPYLNSSETFCTLEPPGESETDHSTKKSLVHITVDKYVTVVFNYGEPTVQCTEGACQYSKSNVSRMMIFEDLGESSKLKFSGDFANPFQALAYHSSDTFWTAIFDVVTKQSILQQYNFQTGRKMSTINIAKLLAVEGKQLNATSEITFLDTSSTSHPLVFCVLVDNTHSQLVAVDISDEKLLWTVDMGSEQCVGQISSVDGAKDSFLIVTTISHMFVYSLT